MNDVMDHLCEVFQVKAAAEEYAASRKDLVHGRTGQDIDLLAAAVGGDEPGRIHVQGAVDSRMWEDK
jgi:hypothetical protein